SKVLKETNLSSPRALNRLTAVQFKKPPRRKTSPLSWFPRKKGDSYLKRKLKLLQEVDGMNSTLDETLCDTNPHFSKVLKEKMAVREAAHKAIEARKAALVEASWLRILRAARIECKEAEDLLLKAEKTATEAFESAKEIGVIMYDIQDHPRKHFKLETSATNGGESTTHTVTTSFDTPFEVDKQVAAAVKAAFVKLLTCASIGKEEFKELLKKISQNPDLDENCQDICEYASECESDTGIESEPKSHKNETEFTPEKLVDMMLQRLRCLREEELASLATIVATCGLNAALSEAENGFQTNKKKQDNEELPGLDKFLVKRLTRLERDVLDARNARTKETGDKTDIEENDSKISKEPEKIVPDLGSMLIKHSSKLEKEIEEIKKKCGNEYEPKFKKSERLKQETKDVPGLGEVLVKRVSRLAKEKKEKENMNFNKEIRSKEKGINDDSGFESLDKVLVKHVSRLEKEKMAFGDMQEEVKVKRKDKIADWEHGEGSLDQIMVKHKSRLEREKVAATDVDIPDDKTKNPVLARRAARERELQEAWGGMSFGDMKEEVKVKRKDKVADLEHGEGSLDQIMVKHKSRLEREKAAAADVDVPDNKTKNPVLARRAARERELQEAWGGMSFGNSIRPYVSRLQRDKAAWLKAEEEERRVSEETRVV
ncbi:hypothetical protein Tco_1059007, partial [Tanacetum coccineum]